MDSRHLKREQAQQLHDSLRPMLSYLTRLRTRMERTGFPPTDPLFLLVDDLQGKMQTLVIELHYLSCKSGVGREPRP